MTSPQPRREPLLLDQQDDDRPPPLQQVETALSSSKSVAAATAACSPLKTFLVESVWPGLGLLGESYMLFSLGIFEPVWELLFPECYRYIAAADADIQMIRINTCLLGGDGNLSRISLLPVVTVLGLMAGMVGMGSAARWTGRRTGSIGTATCMCAGGYGMTLVAFLELFQNQQRLAMRALALSLFVLGVGVGGEYPLAAASASERAMEEMMEAQQPPQQWQQPTTDDPHIGASSSSLSHEDDLKIHNKMDSSLQHHHTQPSRRGRQVQLVFTMQGAGIFLNSLILTVLLWATNQRTDDYDVATLRTVWQITCVPTSFDSLSCCFGMDNGALALTLTHAHSSSAPFSFC